MFLKASVLCLFTCVSCVFSVDTSDEILCPIEAGCSQQKDLNNLWGEIQIQSGESVCSPLVAVVSSSNFASGDNCYPFGVKGTGEWGPHFIVEYKNIPAFTIGLGDILAFDMVRINDFVPAFKSISFALPVSESTIGYTTIVGDSASIGLTVGDTVLGNFDLQFLVTGSYNFPGGNLLLRFESDGAAATSTGFINDASYTYNIRNVVSSDSSNLFVRRYWACTDGTTATCDSNPPFELSWIPEFKVCSSNPTGEPSGKPSLRPSGEPSSKPSRHPSGQPSAKPSDEPTGEPTSSPTAYLNVRTCSADHNGLHTAHTDWDFDADATNTISGEDLSASSVDPALHLFATYFHDSVRNEGVLYTGGQQSSVSIKNAHILSSLNMYSVSDVTGAHVIPSEGIHTVDISAPCGRCPKPKPKHKPVTAAGSSELNSTLQKPPPSPPLTTPYHFSLNGVESSGVAKACGLPFLASLVYPRYSIVGEDGKEFLTGPLCGNKLEEACEAVLPLKGQLVFRVSGFASDDDANKFQWKFCGLTGTVGASVIFEMHGPECIVISIDSNTQGYAHVDEYFNWVKTSSSVALSSLASESSLLFLSSSLVVVMLVGGVVVLSLFMYWRRGSASELISTTSQPSAHGLISDYDVELEMLSAFDAGDRSKNKIPL